MEFIFWSIVGLVALAVASMALVEGACLISRTYARVSYWFRYHYPSWRSARQVAELKRRYGSTGRRSLGQLRFTVSRAESLERESDGPPDCHGQ